MDFEKKQKLPESNFKLYEKDIEYAIIEETINKVSARKLLDNFVEKSKLPSINFLRDAIISCEASRTQ